MPSSMYDSFKTNKEAEKKGVIFDYGLFRVTLARAGGSNTQFQKILEAKTKPYRYAIDKGLIPDEKAQQLYLEAFAEGVVRNWEVPTEFDDHGDATQWQQGIEGEDGETLEFNTVNVVKTLKNLPELFQAFSKDSSEAAAYRQQLLDEDAKN